MKIDTGGVGGARGLAWVDKLGNFGSEIGDQIPGCVSGAVVVLSERQARMH
jgi:hypothetical protein